MCDTNPFALSFHREQFLERLLNSKATEDTVTNHIHAIPIRLRELGRFLSDPHHMNDDTMNAFTVLMKEKQAAGRFEDCRFCSSAFYSKLMQNSGIHILNEYKYTPDTPAVARRLRDKLFTEVHRTFIIIFEDETSTWGLVVIDAHALRIEAHECTNHSAVISNVMRWMKDEYAHRKEGAASLDLSGWKTCVSNRNRKHPGDGAFVLCLMQCLAEGPRAPVSDLDLIYDLLPSFRKHLAFTLSTASVREFWEMDLDHDPIQCVLEGWLVEEASRCAPEKNFHLYRHPLSRRGTDSVTMLASETGAFSHEHTSILTLSNGAVFEFEASSSTILRTASTPDGRVMRRLPSSTKAVETKRQGPEGVHAVTRIIDTYGAVTVPVESCDGSFAKLITYPNGERISFDGTSVRHELPCKHVYTFEGERGRKRLVRAEDSDGFVYVYREEGGCPHIDVHGPDTFRALYVGERGMERLVRKQQYSLWHEYTGSKGSEEVVCSGDESETWLHDGSDAICRILADGAIVWYATDSTPLCVSHPDGTLTGLQCDGEDVASDEVRQKLRVECCVCMSTTAPTDRTILPCQHWTCSACASRISEDKHVLACPLCRRRVEVTSVPSPLTRHGVMLIDLDGPFKQRQLREFMSRVRSMRLD